MKQRSVPRLRFLSAVAYSGGAFAKAGGRHLMQVFLLMFDLERELNREVFAHKAVDKELAHQLF